MTTDHSEWRIGIVWLSRRLGRPDRMLRRRFRAGRGSAADGRPSTVKRTWGKGDAFEAAMEFLTAEGIGLAILLVVVFVVLGPGLLALTIGAVEILLLVMASVVAAVVRIAAGRPWNVLARHPDDEISWRVVGYRRARSLVEEVETAARLGIDLRAVAGELQDDQPLLDGDHVPELYSASAFRLAGRLVGFAIGVVGVIAIALVWLRVT